MPGGKIMIVVRTEFQCNPGGVKEFVEGFKAMAEQTNGQDVIKRSRIMTDLSGSFDTVVVESDIESIDAYFAMLQAAFADPEFQADQSRVTLLAYRGGQRTFYTLEATYELEVIS
jgi:hypothetical protein